MEVLSDLAHHDTLVRGLRVHWAECGRGPALLLIHGFLVSHKEWLPLLPLLSPRFRCIVPDLPGSGASEKRSPDSFPYTREAFVDTLATLLSELGVERAHVCGHSMGGGIALALAADHPSRVERLTVIDAACYPFPVPFKARLPLLPILGPLVFKHLYRRPVFLDYFRNEVWSGHPGLDESRVDEYYADFSTPSGREAGYATLQRTATEHATLVPKIPRVAAPSLVIWGDEDRIFPVSLSHRLVREIPDANLKILDGCGHAPNEERPADTARLLLTHHLGERA